MNTAIQEIRSDFIPFGVRIHANVDQGSEEWLALRCGLLTASEMKYAISRKTDRKTGAVSYKTPDDDKAVSHLYELAAQRVTRYVEPHYISDDMLRGKVDEHEAKLLYAKNYLKNVNDLTTVGFITNDKWGFTLGYSPDGLVLDDGVIECKSRRQKYQFESVVMDEMPEEYKIQVQAGLLVSERKWCDFVSYSGGLPMMTKRIYPDKTVQEAILDAAGLFHGKLNTLLDKYHERIAAEDGHLISTERKIEQAMETGEFQ